MTGSLPCSALLRDARARLKAAGVGMPVLDAEVLLAHVIGIDRLALLTEPDRKPTLAQARLYEELLARRSAHEPVSQIIGYREFWSLPFKVTADTLSPRPDSESLIEAVLETLDRRGISRKSPLRLLDLGTGTGCLLLTLLAELENAWGTGIDLSDRALNMAVENSVALNLANRAHFMRAGWATACCDHAFDLIVSNPPYIRATDIKNLEQEVREHEPRLALDGGEDGLDAYRILVPEAQRLLVPGGYAFFEVGAGQAGDVVALCQDEPATDIKIYADLSGVQRCVAARFMA